MTELRKPEAFELKDDDPWANDVLKRKAVANYLTPVIASISQPFVVSIGSPFGTGKTTFIKCWQKTLENDGFKCVYFNAWETDFSQDALSAVIASLKRQLEEPQSDGGESSIAKKFRQLSKKAGRLIRDRGIPLGVKTLTRLVVGESGAKEIVETLHLSDEGIAELFGSIAEERIKAQEMAEQSMDGFRKYLGEIVAKLSENDSDTEKKKVIVFVDELDRCRPPYAIEVLECIKHFFGVPGLVFVLAIDDSQLRNSVSSVYGANIDTDGYIRRFIDWRFVLPLPSPRDFANALAGRFQFSKIKALSMRSDDLFDLKGLVTGFVSFAEGLRLSLREQEQCFTKINLVLRSLKEGSAPFSIVLGSFVALRARMPEQLRRCAHGIVSVEEFIEQLSPMMQQVTAFREWREPKATIHAWFLDERLAQILKAQHQRVSEELNQSMIRDIAFDERDKIQRESDHLGKVWSYYSHVFNNFGRRHTSLARTTLDRLENAAEYLGGVAL
jgi:hypothetical protein